VKPSRWLNRRLLCGRPSEPARRVALTTALLAPHRVSALVLVAAVLDGVPWDDDAARANQEVERAAREDGIHAARRAWLAHPPFTETTHRPELADRLREMLAGYPRQHWRGEDPHLPSDVLSIRRLGEVRAPMTVLIGDRGIPCFRAMARILTDGIPASRHPGIPASRHPGKPAGHGFPKPGT
jgi:pimeloyl-ACP methyl ester carboxylesterase